MTRTFQASTTLLYLDSPYYDFSETSFQLAENPVTIRNDDGNTIGYATIKRDEREVRATLFLDYATPERFDIEVGALKLYARANGDGYLSHALANSVDVYTDILKKPRIVRVFIENIILTTVPPADARIEPLKWEPKETP